MLFFDALYLIVVVASLLVSLAAQAWVLTAIRSQADVPTSSGLTGAQAARMVLQAS